MENVLVWGLEVVRDVQSFAVPGFATAMKAITRLGAVEFYLVALPLVYWCVDRRKGVRLGIAVLLSSFINLWSKTIFMQPRPYDMDPSVMLVYEPTYGLPSGHSQGTITFWGMLAWLFRTRILVVLAVLVPLVVGFSRIYLGAHFPTDVFAGWFAGIVSVGLFGAVGERIGTLFKTLPRRFKLIVIAAVSLGMNFLMKEDTMLSGVFFGAGAGFVIASDSLCFTADGSLRERALRYLVGITTMLVVYLSPKFVLGDGAMAEEPLIRFLRYGMVGLWVSLGAPWLLVRIGLLGLDKTRISCPDGETP